MAFVPYALYNDVHAFFRNFSIGFAPFAFIRDKVYFSLGPTFVIEMLCSVFIDLLANLTWQQTFTPVVYFVVVTA